MATNRLTTPMMAHLLLPSRSVTRVHKQHLTCLYQSSRERLQAYRDARLFSTSAIARVHDATFRMNDRRQAKGMSSPKMQQAQALAKGQNVPTDVGLIPHTFIMPTSDNLPSWIYDTRQRLMMEYYRWRAKAFNLYTSYHYKWQMRTSEQKKAHGKIILNYPFRTGKIAAAAEDLHREMYTALAAGDVHTLKKLCADGVLAQLLARLSRRARGEHIAWDCERRAAPKLVSHRATFLPYKNADGSEAGVRQAVVRLRTLQSLRRTTTRAKQASKTAYQRNIESLLGKRAGEGASAAGAGGDEVVVNEGEPKEVTEYFVIQRRLWKGAEEPWMVWGMTEETTVAGLLEMRDEMKLMTGQKQTQAVEALRATADAKS